MGIIWNQYLWALIRNCFPHNRSCREVAIKIIKNVPKYRAAAKIEIRVLEQIKDIVEDGQE